MRKQSGFTLIELVAVIVILAILAVVAVPQYVNLRTDAQNAATAGVAGALASGTALNYAVRSVNSASGQAVLNCTAACSTLAGGLCPSGYSVASLAITSGNVGNCTVSGPNSSSAPFNAIGIN